MRTATRIALCFFALISATAAAENDAEEEIRAVLERQERGYQECNVDFHEAAIHPEWTGFPPGGGPLVEGGLDLSGLRTQCTEGWDFDLTLTPQRIDVRDNWALAMGRTTGQILRPNGEVFRNADSRWTLVYVKEGGAWQVYHGHLSPFVDEAE